MTVSERDKIKRRKNVKIFYYSIEKCPVHKTLNIYITLTLPVALYGC
jgi:hypothetical protein